MAKKKAVKKKAVKKKAASSKYTEKFKINVSFDEVIAASFMPIKK